MLAIAGPSKVTCRNAQLRIRYLATRLYSDASASSSPRPTIELDPSFRELFPNLKDFKQKTHHHPNPPVELHVYERTEAIQQQNFQQDADLDAERREERRSPVAVFGSQKLGHVVLSPELDKGISDMIQNGDKHQLRSDAKRLFLHPSPASAKSMRWGTSLPPNKSKDRDRKMAARDGLAFVAVAMPAQYAVVMGVLHELKGRLGPDWQIEQVVDFGAKTGAGFWATRDALGGIKHYAGIDSRTGIASLAQELAGAAAGGSESSTQVAFLKKWGKDAKGLRSPPNQSLALCAFTLSELKTDLDRKMMLREMWNSGAETIVIIDHGSKEGFQYIGDAREYLLRTGRRELTSAEERVAADPTTEVSFKELGCHVVAPCPHDGACPLHTALRSVGDKKGTRLMKHVTMGPTPFCHFTQRLHRPEFVRLTKHSTQSHEDTLYSYVVIHRGARPSLDPAYNAQDSETEASSWTRNRIGGVAREARLAAEQKQRMEQGGSGVVVEGDDGELHFAGSAADDQPADLPVPIQQPGDAEGLRHEAYEWPRVIYPPMKRSGHVILDSCTKDGNISRMTIPKSQGKQPYYDARKSSWGDVFPHAPKNGLEVRTRGATTSAPSVAEENAEDRREMEEFMKRTQNKDGTFEFIV